MPGDLGEGIVGDLDEVYRERRSDAGPVATGLWYAGQVAAIATRLTWERARDTISAAHASLSLDLRLGVRMLVKYPMLTLVGGIAITVASSIGVGASEFVRDMLMPTLPLDEGERIVRVVQVDTEAGERTAPTLYDLEIWRDALGALDDLAAYRTLEQGIVTDRGEVGTVSLARTSREAFDLTRVPPLLGRALIDADARPDAPATVVLGYSVWQSVLQEDPDPIGRTVRLGGVPTTVVGVMPEGYGFPLMQDAWVAMRADSSAFQPTTAGRASVVARLATGATLASVQVELDAVGRRLADEHPEVYARLTPRVESFADRASSGVNALILSGVGIVFALLLAVACVNVATLVFARTVTREGEIAIRRSLGASRRRIVMQLFAEALVLVGGATGLGMFLAWWSLGRIAQLFFQVQQAPQPPFWWDDNLSSTTLMYGVGLAVAGAVLVGVVPALKATGGHVQPRLGQGGSGVGRLNFGGVWTAVIVLQVALTVAFLPVAVAQATEAFANPVDSGFPADAFLTAQLGRDPVAPPRTLDEHEVFLDESSRLFETVRDQIAQRRDVRGAALASGLSAMNHLNVPAEVVDDRSGEGTSGSVRILLVDPHYLDLIGATTVAGRPLQSSDFFAEGRAVVVNETFAERRFAGRNPVGATVRFPKRRGESDGVSLFDEGEAVQIVGVVRDPGIDAFGPGVHPALYAPLSVAPASPRTVGLVGMPQAPATQLFVRMSDEGGLSASHLYEIAGAIDPDLRLSEIATAADAWAPVHTGERLAGWIVVAMAAIVLMLSVAGIYALMSFTVSRRSREIAIRLAVGASRRRIVEIVFRRAVLQLLAGVALGSIVALAAFRGGDTSNALRALGVVAVLLTCAGTAACFVPIRRALTVDPAATMKGD